MVTAKPKEEFEEEIEEFDLVNEHTAAPQQYDFAEVIDISGDTATVRWMDGSGIEHINHELKPAETDIVGGRIDIGRCMFYDCVRKHVRSNHSS